jgi:hypothetical protein
LFRFPPELSRKLDYQLKDHRAAATKQVPSANQSGAGAMSVSPPNNISCCCCCVFLCYYQCVTCEQQQQRFASQRLVKGEKTAKQTNTNNS